MTVANTLLSISGAGLPPFSVRGLTQTLEPIAASAVARRTVNGTLVDLSAPELRKYRSTISCSDQQPPAFDALWPGMILTIESALSLGYETNTVGPDRTAVAGSEREESGFGFYRLELDMMVVSPWTLSFDEYGAANAWQLDLEEV